ncbi:MAG: hypothetical protein ACI89X_001342 [Planctomycetota bacterium]|jgi:hypothetical protein
MKTRNLFASIFLFAGLTACASGRHFEVQPDEFVRLAKTQAASMFYSGLIGATGSHAFLSVWRGPGWFGGAGDKDIYSVELTALPKSVVTRIRSGQDPWPK